MRIAQVAPLYESVPPGLYGGTERVVSWLTEALVKAGHEVTLFASGDSVTSALLVPCCKSALRLDPDSIDHLAHHVLMIETVFQQADSFDLIHFHTDYLHFPYARREQIPCLTTLHGRLDIPDLVPIYREFRDLPLVSISDAQRKPLPWVNWVGTVYHGMPQDSLVPTLTAGHYLAFLGRVSPEKGLDRAIEIAIRSGMPLKVAAKVDRADQDYYESRIKPMLQNSLIEFVGEIGNSEKSEFLGNAAALLFPVDWPEPFGVVMIEAMACGTPVIACPLGSVPEVVRPGISGILIKDVNEGVQAVRRIGEIDRSRVRHHFELNFTDELMASNYLNIYQQLVDSKPASLQVEKEVLSWMEGESQTPSTT